MPLPPTPPAGPVTLSQNARTVLAKRYLVKDAAGKPTEQPEDMFWRVATVVAEADRRYGAGEVAVNAAAEEFYALMTQRRFEPNSPTLMNAGRPLGQLSACFVLPVADSLSNGKDGIYDTLRSMALIHQSGGGTGFSFSRLRPKGSMVRSTTGVASGPVSFMKLYDASTDAVKQGGCVVPDTRVSTNRGIVPIRELGPADAPADSWHRHARPLAVATDAGPQGSDEFYNHGVATVRRIRTASGYHLAATLQHRVRVIDAQGGYVWRRLDELAVGDWVVLQKGHLLEPEDYALPGLATEPHFNATPVRLPAEASEQLGEFLGYVVGDGAFNRYNVGGGTGRLILTVCDDQPDVAAWLTDACEGLFGLTPTRTKKPDDGSTNYFLCATRLVNWLEQIGAVKESAATARVPEIVFRKGVRMARGFLRGLFTADGTIYEEGYPSLSSVSRDLIDDVQQLLLAVGVPSSVSVTTDRDSAFGDRPLYRLRVTTQSGLDVFAHDIGFIDGARATRLPRGLEKAWEQNDVIPNQEQVIQAAYARPGRGSGPGRGSRGANRELYRDIQHYLPDVAAPRHLTRSRLATLAEKHEEIRSSPLMWFLAHDQFYDQVASIEESESLTLDLSVPANNTYVANGFVSHNTRRGANMGILRVDHPDILEFITCKEDLTQVTNFNISVAVTEKFMEAVRDKTTYDLVDPTTKQVTGQLDANMVWDKMILGAWRTGEPGCFFIDEANRYNPTPHLFPYEATNPCLAGDTLVLTVDGPRRFDELARHGANVEVYALNRTTGERTVRTMRHPRLTKSDTRVLKVTFDSGLVVRCTPDHNWITPSGEKIQAQELTQGMRVAGYSVTADEPTAAVGNHVVMSVEEAGTADVYNGTVDEVHTYVVVDPEACDGASAFTGVVSANCGEQPLGPYDVCNLGSINVGYYVVDGKMDWEAFRRDIHTSTHFLDNIIDVNKYPLPEIDALSKRIRRIGLGVMGFADALVRLGIPYDSPEGVEMGRRVMEFVDVESKKESERLANERGPFPEWARSIWGPDATCGRDKDGKRIRAMQLLRNCNVTTVAPTGTISIIAGCSSGLEPLFAVAFMRNQAGVMMPDVNEDFVAVARREGWYSDELMERIAREGTINFPEVPERWQRVFVTANQIAPEWHERTQAAFQQHCDSAISKTTNFAHTASVEDVRAIYELAHALKCKGVTVYRDGSRDNQVLSTGATEKAKAEREKGVAAPAGASAAAAPAEAAVLKREVGELQGTLAELRAELERTKKALFDVEAENLQRRAKRARPDKLRGTTIRKETPLGTMFVNITEDDRGQPFEVFLNLGKAGGSAMADAEAMGRMISLALRSGIPLMEIHRQLRGISSDRAVGLGPNKVLSVPDAIGIALEEWWREKQGVQQDLLDASQRSQNGTHGPVTNAPVAKPEVTVGRTPGASGAEQQQFGLEAYDGGQAFMGTCPDCGSQLEYAEGCVKCHVCGFSECG